jgi:hypothetical protein
MTDVYNAVISRDFQKKRKKWIDGRVTIESSSRMVNVFEVQEDGLGPGKQVYSGIMDVKILSKFIDTEEVKLGSVLVCITDKTGDCKILTESAAGGLHVDSTAPSIPVRLKLPLFKQPLKNTPVMGAVTSQDDSIKMIGQSKSTHKQKVLHIPENSEVTMRPDLIPRKVSNFSSVTTTSSSSSMLSGTLNSRSNGNEKTNMRDGMTDQGNSKNNNGSSQTISNQMQHGSLQLKLYNHLHRFCKVDMSFKNPNDYAVHFSAALWEEIQLNIASNMSSLENRALISLGINQKDMPPLNGDRNDGRSITGTGVGTGVGTAGTGTGTVSQKLYKPLVTMKVSQRPSIEACTEKVRSAGIAFTNRVEVIVSQPRTEDGTYVPWTKTKGNSTYKDLGSEFPEKRSKFGYSDTGNSGMKSINSHSDGGSEGGTEGQVSETKLYFKILDGKHKIPPNGTKNLNLKFYIASYTPLICFCSMVDDVIIVIILILIFYLIFLIVSVCQCFYFIYVIVNILSYLQFFSYPNSAFSSLSFSSIFFLCSSFPPHFPSFSCLSFFTFYFFIFHRRRIVCKGRHLVTMVIRIESQQCRRNKSIPNIAILYAKYP